MAEEFEESEVMFPDREEYSINDYHFTHEENFSNDDKANKKRTSNSQKIKNNNKRSERWGTTGSLPVDIPSISNVLRLGHDEHQDWLEEEYDGGELVPPHIIVGRRIAGKMAFSVCTGNGRTLKGRDLSELRNSILRLTGFLET